MRLETADRAVYFVRVTVVLLAFLVAPYPTILIGLGNFCVLSRSHYRFGGGGRFAVMLFLNVIEYALSGLFCSACTVLPLAIMLGAAVASAFFLYGPVTEPEPASRIGNNDKKYIAVEVIDNKGPVPLNRKGRSVVKVVR